jgi:uncharacterized repeat protein (TIGR01451 family)
MRKTMVTMAALTSLTLFLAACGGSPAGTPQTQTTPVNNTTPVAQTGSVEITVDGLTGGAKGKVVIIDTKTGDIKKTEELGVGTKTFSGLAVGTYLVGGLRVASYDNPGVEAVKVTANGKVTTKVNYKPAGEDCKDNPNCNPGGGGGTPTPGAGTVMTTEIVSVLDDDKNELPFKPEINSNGKKVNLYAAQSEDQMCFTILAKDSAGKPVPNANVIVQGPSADNGKLYSMAPVASCVIKDGTNPFQGTVTPGQTGVSGLKATSLGAKSISIGDSSMKTDSKGEAHFVLFAAGAFDPYPFQSLYSPPAFVMYVGGKRLDEFKVFFYGISHIYNIKNPRVDAVPAEQSAQRRGSTFVPAVVNLFKPLGNSLTTGDPEANIHTIYAGVKQKQPDEFLRNLGGPNGVDVFQYQYELLEGADKVEFVANQGCATSNPVTGLPVDPKVVCFKGGVFTGASIAPKASVGLNNLGAGVKAKVKVSLWINQYFGSHNYWYLLKDFTMSKVWEGTYLTINKSVDHHVLTWAGGATATKYTLNSYDAAEVAANSVFTSTMTILVSNPGGFAAKNVTIVDGLPAELGIIRSTIKVDDVATGAGTYAADTHAIALDKNNMPKLASLAAGQTVKVTFQVYVRQKPGFCWDDDAINGYPATRPTEPTNGFMVKPIAECPSDPYRVVNGDKLNDVTAEWYTGADKNAGGHKVLIDYIPAANAKGLYDSEINAVRPVFDVTKKVTTTPSSALGDVVGSRVSYSVQIVNFESDGSDSRGPRYAELRSNYGYEFNGGKATAAAVQNTLGRDNPYARNVKVSDIFGRGLKFVSASTLNVANNAAKDFGANVVAAAVYGTPGSVFPQPNQTSFAWPNIPLMGGGDTGNAEVVMAGVLAAADFKSTLWTNCALLDANNLNQPDPEFTKRISPTKGGIVDPNLAPDWAPGSVDGNGNTIQHFHGPLADRAWDLFAFPVGLGFAPWPATVTQLPNNAALKHNVGIRSCVGARFYVPNNPYLGHTTTRERADNTALALPDADPYAVGKKFFYSFIVSNIGGPGNTAQDVTLDLTLSKPAVRFTDGGAAASGTLNSSRVYLCTDLDGTAGCVDTGARGTFTATGNGKVSFADAGGATLDLPAGQSLSFFIEATAVIGNTSNTNADSSVNYANALQQVNLPLTAQESTTTK